MYSRSALGRRSPYSRYKSSEHHAASDYEDAPHSSYSDPEGQDGKDSAYAFPRPRRSSGQRKARRAFGSYGSESMENWYAQESDIASYESNSGLDGDNVALQATNGYRRGFASKHSYGKRQGTTWKKTGQLDDSVPNAVNYMVGLLSKREYSAQELLEKGKTRYSASALNAALEQCIERGYQSDERYAQMLIRHIEFACYGPVKLQFEARRKGIEMDLIYQNSQEVDWDELAFEALVKKYGRTQLDFEQGRKAMAYLARRGFDASCCIGALNRLKQELRDEE